MKKRKSHDEIESLRKIIKQKNAEIFQLRSIIDYIPGDVYWKNKEGVYLGMNATGSDSLHKMGFIWKTSDIIGKTDYDLYDRETSDAFRKNDLEIMRTGIEETREESANLPSGEKIVQLSTKKPLYDESGNIAGVIGNTIDITYLKKVEDDLRDEKEKAEKANIAKTEFIRNMEHDIRTPVSGVWGIANALWEQETEVGKKEFLGDITQCAKELLDYCNGILDFSKIEAGMYTIMNKKFNLEDLINSVIKMETPAAKHRKLLLKKEYDKKIPSILISDSDKISRILINLVSNAVKFTHEGSITLTVELISKKSKQALIRFTVQDTGIGIPTEKKEFIFEKFTRLSLSNKGIYKGIGLGLRVVKQFMYDLGGEIDVISESNKGTQFVCTIPFKLPLTNDFVE